MYKKKRMCEKKNVREIERKRADVQIVQTDRWTDRKIAPSVIGGNTMEFVRQLHKCGC